MTENAFSAAASALGYAYQFRYSLVLALGRLSDLGWAVALEAADDIEVTGVSDVELVQLKHRAPASVLTDASPDLWKSLRIWSEGISSGRLDVANTRLLLVTTGSIAPDGVAASLSDDAGSRNVVHTVAELRAVAATSTSTANAAAYAAFGILSEDEQYRLLDSVAILSGQANIGALDEELRAICVHAVRREHLGPFLERLEGWWFRRCLQQLAQPGGNAILAEEIDGFFVDLRERFRSTNLPIDSDVEFLEAQSRDFQQRTFVHQLEIAGIGEARVDFAIRDYLRAFTQRSRWSRDGLLLVGELDRYERRLVDEWSRTFERMRDELGTDAADDEQMHAAQQIYGWIESADISIRPECNEPFVVRGSFQMLSDDQRVGWHPDFAARLIALLEPTS